MLPRGLWYGLHWQLMECLFVFTLNYDNCCKIRFFQPLIITCVIHVLTAFDQTVNQLCYLLLLPWIRLYAHSGHYIIIIFLSVLWGVCKFLLTLRLYFTICLGICFHLLVLYSSFSFNLKIILNLSHTTVFRIIQFIHTNTV